MLKKLSPIFSNITGVVRYQDLAYVASVSDEIQEQNMAHSYVTEWDCGTWCVAGEDDDMLPWEIVSATVVHEPVEQALFLGARGQVFCMGSGDIHEALPDGDDAIGGRGNMRGVACIDGVAYACGMDRQVYRRFDENDWRHRQRRSASAAERSGGRIRGHRRLREIYAVGWDGEIWQYDGKRWQPRRARRT